MKYQTYLSIFVLLMFSLVVRAQQKATPVAKIRIENGKIVSFENLNSSPSLDQKQKTGSTQLVHGTHPEGTHNYQDKNLQQNNSPMSTNLSPLTNTAVSSDSKGASSLMYQPDLQVTGVNVTNTNLANLTYDITIKNEGRVSLNTTFHNYVYLSTDKQIGSGGDIKIDDWVIQSNPYTFFTAGTSKNSGNRTVNVKGKPPGNYYVGVVADAEGNITESDEQNNTGYDDSPKVSITAKPDLVITQLSLTKIEQNSLKLTVSFKIKNQGQKSVDFGDFGDLNADFLTLGFYLSSDQSISLNDYLYGTRLMDGALAPGETRTCNNYKVPAENKEIPQGEYYLGLYVDSDCEYSESSESNNTRLADGPKVPVPQHLPDLDWGESGFNVLYQYDEIDSEKYLDNNGWADINTPFHWCILLSGDETSDDSDAILHEGECTELEFQGSISLGWQIVPTHDIPAGTYYLIYEADTENTISELSEDNNRVISEPFEIAHLQVQNPNGGEIWVKEHPYSIQWTTQGTVPYVSISLYKDDNPQEGIATDTPNTGIFEYSPPNSLPDGTTYKIRVQDKDRKTYDISDNQFTIQTSSPNTYQPDLIVTDVNISNADPASLSYEITIKNEGRVNINTTFHNYVYLSTDINIGNTDDIKIDDWVIQSNPYTFFTAGTSKNSGTRTVNVSHLATGEYYLGVKADAENNITESDDYNNTGYDNTPKVSISAKPDLVVTSFRIDEMKKNNHEISTQIIIKNQGDKPIDCTQQRLSIATYLSEDQDIDKDSDYFFDENSDNPNLSPGQSIAIAEKIFYGPDNIIPQGNYWFGIHIDFTEVYDEKDENNNTDVASNTQVTITATPDLTWQESSGIEYIEDGITLKYYIIENIGWSEVTEPFENRFLLSENKILDENDHEIAHFTHNTELGMMRLTNYNISASTRNVPAGKYYLIMQTDYGQGVTELSENNNIWITDEQADIVHLNLTYPNGGETWVKGNPYTVRWTTEGTVSNITLELHKGDEFVSLITENETNNGSFEVTIPASMEDGNDYKFYIFESGTHCRTHDFSNDYFTIQTTAPTNPQPDLIVQSVEVLDSEGPEIRYQGTIKNQGDASAGQSTAKFYLSSDNQISSSDYHLHSWSLTGSLNAGNSINSGEVTTTVSGVPAGEYYLGIIADAGGQVSESNENNNKAYDESPKVTISESSGYQWADIDKDGDVDIVDVQMVAARYGSKTGDGTYLVKCDVDGDGDIDIVDVQKVAAQYGTVF